MLAVIGREARGVSAVETQVLSQLANLVSRTIALRLRYLEAGRLDDWEEAQRELADNLDENAALARYLTSRNGRIDLDDDDVLALVQRRLKSVGNVLDRRMREVQQAV